MKRLLIFVLLNTVLLCGGTAFAQAQRIIALSGALSETVHALGLGSRIVGVDVTSEYPEEIARKPRVSKDRTVSLEGLLAFRPDLILAPQGDIAPGIERQLRQLGMRLVTFRQEYSVKGTERFIREVAAATGVQEAGTRLAAKVSGEVARALAQLRTAAQKPKVLFIYAQGVGLMSVAGKGSQIDAIIGLAGGRNAVQQFSDFRPYSTEALVKANPDVILLFDFGMSSLGGRAAVLRMPGVSLTNAGKQGRVVAMDGPLLSNFSTRLAQAIRELHSKLYDHGGK